MKLLILMCILAGAAVTGACSGDDADNNAQPTATPSPPSASTTRPTATSTPAPTATASPVATSTEAATPVAPPDAMAALAALNGLGCTGEWHNPTTGGSGALSIRLEAGGGGGLITFEIGGPLFGAQGGVFEAPFHLEERDIVLDTSSDFLGHVTARAALDGTAAEATLSVLPALGASAVVTMSDYSFASNVLHFALTTNYGDGRPSATSEVAAACAHAH